MAKDNVYRDGPVENGLSSEGWHRKILDWVETSSEELRGYRSNAERDRDYYDGHQWTDAEIQRLEKRGQPVVTFNHIKPKINFILGTEVRTRVDPHAYPRTLAHDDDSYAMSDALRFVSDREKFPKKKSASFEDMLIEGCGAGLLGIRKEGSGKDAKVEIDITHIEWDRIVFDHRSKKKDFSDARWVGNYAWLDLDEAVESYPSAKTVLEESVAEAGDVHETFEDSPSCWARRGPDRVRILQCFFYYRRQWYEAQLTKRGWVKKPARVKFQDEDGNTWCPQKMACSFRTRRTSSRASEPQGVVRDMISPQDEINKRRSKALHLSNQNQIWAEDGAIQLHPDEAREEAAKPDAYVPLSPGGLQRMDVRNNLDLAASQLQLLGEAVQSIHAIGPQAPLIAQDQRVQTGRSLQVRQQAGEMQLEPVFDSMRDWQQRMFTGMGYLIRQYWPEERWLAVRDDSERRGYRFVAVNRKVSRSERLKELLAENVPFGQAINMVGLQPVEAQELVAKATQTAQQAMQAIAAMAQQAGQELPPEALQGLMQAKVMELIAGSPVMKEQFKQNDVSRLVTDIVIDAAPDTVIQQQEEFDKLAELMGTGNMPIPPAVLLKASQLRNKNELIAMMEKPPPDPIAEQMAQLNLALLAAEVEKTRAEAMDRQASAMERQANAEFKLGPQAEKTSAQALDTAATAGQKVGGV